MRRVARILARNLARNVTCGNAFWIIFVLRLLFRASGIKVVRSVVRSLCRNAARNDAGNARPSALRFADDVDFRTETGSCQVRDATRHRVRPS